MDLIYIFHITNEIVYFLCLLAIWISSFVKCLLKSSHFSIRLSSIQFLLLLLLFFILLRFFFCYHIFILLIYFLFLPTPTYFCLTLSQTSVCYLILDLSSLASKNLFLKILLHFTQVVLIKNLLLFLGFFQNDMPFLILSVIFPSFIFVAE